MQHILIIATRGTKHAHVIYLIILFLMIASAETKGKDSFLTDCNDDFCNK